MTRAKDISKIITDADFSGTLDVTGDLTVVGSSTFDDIKLTAVSLPAAGNPSIALRDTNNIVYHQSGSGNSIVLLDSSQNTMYNASSTSHIFNISNSEKMRIASSGNVGIGTTSPTEDLDITKSTTVTLHLERSGATALDITASTASVGAVYNSSNFHQFQTSGSERMRIDSSGNVGIGTSTISDELHIKGADPAIRIEDTTAVGYARIQSLNGSLILQSDEGNTVNNSNLRFELDGSEMGRFTDTGILYVGTTDVTSNNGLQLSGTGAMYSQMDGTNSVNQMRFYRNGNNIVGKIQTTGTATTYNTSSDYRLKENVTADWDATTRLKQLNPVRFNFIADADTTLDGFLAHEVQSVVAQAVTGTHNEVEVWQDDEELPNGVSVGDNKLDEDGNTIPVYQGIDQSMLVPLLVKTIQELEARITALETA